MQIFGILIVLAVFVYGAVVQQSKYRETEISPTPTPFSTPTKTPTIIVTLKPPTPTAQTASPQPSDLQVFRYPGASDVSSDASNMKLTSTDGTDAITDWYKEKIKNMGMNAKSFVTTKTNGNVKNVLVGANGEIEIRVEVTKKSGDAVTQITVTMRTY